MRAAWHFPFHMISSRALVWRLLPSAHVLPLLISYVSSICAYTVHNVHKCADVLQGWVPDCAAAAAPLRCCEFCPAQLRTALWLLSALLPASSPAPPEPPHHCAVSPFNTQHTLTVQCVVTAHSSLLCVSKIGPQRLYHVESVVS